MSGHTPGRWTVRSEPMNHKGPAQVGTGSTLTAEVYGSTNAECVANARLIAAAPRMLALLQQIREEYQDTFDASCEPGEGWRGSGRISTTTGEEVCALLATLEPQP